MLDRIDRTNAAMVAWAEDFGRRWYVAPRALQRDPWVMLMAALDGGVWEVDDGADS